MSDLLEYGKPPASEFILEKLGAVVIEAVDNCRPAAAVAQVTLVNGMTADGELSMNHGRLLQVFVNLIDNAIRFAPQDTAVSVVTVHVLDDSGKHWIECSVTDSGAGFPAEDLEFVFDPFFSRRRKGTGLGLAIVKRIVDEHQGFIKPDNRPEGGAIVTVRLPLADTTDEVETTVDESAR